MYTKTMTISFGDYHYEMRFSTDEPTSSERDDARTKQFIYKALIGFHTGYHDQSKTIAEMKRDMFNLAADRPDLIHELTERGLI